MNNNSIALLSIINDNKKFSMNKDLNGGYGTADDFGNHPITKLIGYIRKKSVKIPLLSLAYVQAILLKKKYEVKYFEGSMPGRFDIYIIWGSIVDHKYENYIAGQIKSKYPDSKVGFIGGFPSVEPKIYDNADFIIIGEPESFFMNEFENKEQLNGNVIVKSICDFNTLPTPSFNGFPINTYKYKPALNIKPFITLQATKGCPYSCRYYCTYPISEGIKVRSTSAEKIVDDIIRLKKKYNIKAIQFRDPIFGIDSKFVIEFCNEMINKNVNIKWGMETRLDLLNEDLIKSMFNAGLRSINVGIETNDIDVAKINKRKLVQESHQEWIIKFCDKLGVKIVAFYMMGFDNDTIETVNNMIEYAKKLNTPLARFSVQTPYPGTGYYDKLKKENKLTSDNFEEYTQFNLVYEHNNLDKKDIAKLLKKAYKEYYLRPKYILKFIKWKIRELYPN